MRFAAKGFSGGASPPSRRDWLSAAGDERRASLARVVTTLKSAVEKLQAAQGAYAVNERRKTTEQLTLQVQLLNSAFASLADAVLEEVEELGCERASMHSETNQLKTQMRALEARVEGRMEEMGRLEDRVEARMALTAGLEGQMAALSAGAAATEQRLSELRADLGALQAQAARLEKTQAIAALEAARAALTAAQRAGAREVASEAVREAVPGLIVAGVQRTVPNMIGEAIESRSDEIRREVASQGAILAGDIGRLAREVSAARCDAANASNLAKKADSDVAALEPRVSLIEASESASPKAPLRAVDALERRLEAAAAAQARYRKSVEGVVRALVNDTGALARAQRGAEGLIAGQQAQLQDTKEALLRSAQVFSQLLKVPPPVSAAQWSTTPTKSGPAGSGLRSSTLGPGLGLRDSVSPRATAGAGGGGLFGGGGGGSPLLSSRYASLAAGL